MPATNILANLFVTLDNNETRRNVECTILPTSKLGIEVLKTLQKEGYVGEFEHIDDKRGGKFKINLLAKIDFIHLGKIKNEFLAGSESL